jgi:hypothetical protein
MEFSNLPDEILDKVLVSYDEGSSVADIVAQFPQHKAELEDLFGTISTIRHEGRQLPMPSRESLEAALRSVPIVTEENVQRYPMQEEAHAPSYIIGILNSFESLMKMHWKVIGSLSTVAVVALVFFATTLRQTNAPNGVPLKNGTIFEAGADGSQESALPAPSDMSRGGATMMSTAMAPSAEATGNVDDAIDALFADASAEQAAFDQDASLVLASTDSTALNEFDTTISSYEY